MRYSRVNFLASMAAVALMLIALANSSVTLASQDYRGALLTALVCSMLEVGCLAIPFVRGPVVWRGIAVVLASPALFVIADFVRRAPCLWWIGCRVLRVEYAAYQSRVRRWI